MNNRDLLEKAARAAGYCQFDGNARQMLDAGWNPLADAGDAFRLMAALNLNLEFDVTHQGVEVTVMAIWDGGPNAVSEAFEGNDAAPAMRRAIVRAAASMEEGQ